ncbi:hypothetical protein M0R45_007001 [Rubus argutus]|uniref:Uncharacterized protein n=1 Tax=Rubus argutus TaxID=59490 RepID=A0AAW1YSL5_RUBAR
MEKSNSVKNPIVPGSKLTKDGEGAKVDATLYKQMVGSLMYLTATRPDLMYVVCLISSDYAGDTDDRKSTSGYVFFVKWWSCVLVIKKATCGDIIHTEAEFVAAAACACQGVWVKRVLNKLGCSQYGVVKLDYCGTSEQIADIMTKPLKLEVFVKLRELLGVQPISGVN